MTRSVAVFVLVSWCVSGFAGVRQAGAQPAAGERPLDDEPQFRCKAHPDSVVVTFKTDIDVKDLVAWAVGFTCKSVPTR